MTIQSKLLAGLIFGFWVLFCLAPTNVVTAAAFVAVVLTFGFVQWLERRKLDDVTKLESEVDGIRKDLKTQQEKIAGLSIARGMVGR